MLGTVLISADRCMVPCMNNCTQALACDRSRGHYHCTCAQILSRKRSMVNHIFKKHGKAEPKALPETISVAKAVKKMQKGFSVCPFCDNTMLQRNLNRHIRSKHSGMKNVTCSVGVLVDEKAGIYMVPKNKQGNLQPLHVKFSCSSTMQSIQCEGKQCQLTSQVCSRSDVSYYRCSHVNNLAQADHNTNYVNLRDDALDNLVQQKIINEKSKLNIIGIRDEASSQSCPAVVMWEPIKEPPFRYNYFSVYSKKVTNYSLFGGKI